MEQPPKPARGELALSRGFVDGDNAADLQRLGHAGAAFILRITQNFKLRLDNLQPATARVLFDLAVERDQLSRAEAVFQVSTVEPQTLQRGTAAHGASAKHGRIVWNCGGDSRFREVSGSRFGLACGHLKDRHAAGPKKPGGAYFGDDGGHFAGGQFGDGARVEAIFVAEGQIVEQVFDGADAFGGKHFGHTRPDARNVLDLGLQFQHLRYAPQATAPQAMVNQPA